MKPGNNFMGLEQSAWTHALSLSSYVIFWDDSCSMF